MPINVRRANERGVAHLGWLKSYHTFSFSEYHDPAHMGFRSLRVINEDYLDGGRGYDSHPHKDIEIITYILDGSLRHQGGFGIQENMKAGDIQIMSAGSGIMHGE